MAISLKKRSAPSTESDMVVNTSMYFDDSDLLMLVTPKIEGVNLIKWSNDNWDFLNKKLLEHGAILFRGFNMSTDDDLLGYLKDLPFELIEYVERSSPRKTIAKNVFTSTLYPNDETIALHNENTASITFAQKVWFYCSVQPQEGGETPISCARELTKAIPEDVLSKFRELGWTLIRNYGKYLAYDWKDAFAGRSKEEVEQYCKDNDISFEWKEDEGLKTWQTRPATIMHPDTKEELWFNHIAFWHRANLPKHVLEGMLKAVGDDGLPFDIVYGDGTPIPDDIAVMLKNAYLAGKKKFPWQQGDLLLIDNMIACHAREKFSGPREIRVVMGEPFSRPDC